jgi:Flp pilus assembly protein TadD
LSAAPATQESEVAIDLERAETLSAEGWSLWNKQEFFDAAKRFEQATQANPDLANAWNGLGWSRFNAGMPIQAEKAFVKCLELQPNHAAALNGLGWIHFSRREYDEAEHQFLAAAQLKATASWFGLAKIYLLKGEWDEARKWTEKLVADGSDPEGARKLHDAATTEKLSDELRLQIEPLAPPTTQGSSSRSREALKLQARLRSQKDFEKYSKAQLAEAEQLYQVANKNWRSDAARESLKQMVERFPDINRTGCAVLYLGQMSQGDEREQLLSQAVEKHSDCFYLNGVQVGGFARLLLGLYYMENDQAENARKLFDELRADYAGAIDHKGRTIIEQIPAVP